MEEFGTDVLQCRIEILFLGEKLCKTPEIHRSDGVRRRFHAADIYVRTQLSQRIRAFTCEIKIQVRDNFRVIARSKQQRLAIRKDLKIITGGEYEHATIHIISCYHPFLNGTKRPRLSRV